MKYLKKYVLYNFDREAKSMIKFAWIFSLMFFLTMIIILALLPDSALGKSRVLIVGEMLFACIVVALFTTIATTFLCREVRYIELEKKNAEVKS